MDETVDAMTAEEAKDKLDDDYVKSITSCEGEYGEPIQCEEAEIRISRVGKSSQTMMNALSSLKNK